ncbi:MAG: enoyl-CoA hydratase/isomerase family protein [Niabella sp.]
MYQTIEIEYSDQVTTIWLNRPEVHNAFNEEMIAEITQVFKEINLEENTRMIVLRGRGKSFCAGADINWMRDVAQYSYEQNLKESQQLSECFYSIYTCNKPTIAVVHGAAIGGANGLLAACDFVYAEENTVFSLSEVKIGIIPACISPYIIKRVGEFPAKDLMLTGRRFKAEEAEKLKLINKSLTNDELETTLKETIGLLSSSGPKAIEKCKQLIHKVTNEIDLQEALSFTANIIADIRTSEEGQEGMASFLEKRNPNWVK